MKDDIWTDPAKSLDGTDVDDDELGFEDELESDVEQADAVQVDAELDPEDDENRLGIVLDENEADASEAGGLETFACAFCGEENEVFIDRTVSKRQQFTEDCEVCCRPNLVTVYLDPDGSAWVDAEREDEA